MPGKVNYFIGNDPKKWLANIPAFAKVKFQDVYPGVDLVYYGNHSQVEYDFVITPGADPKAIKLDFDGAEKVEIDARGDLVLHTKGGEVRLLKPRIYQEISGTKQAIPGHYMLLPPPSEDGYPISPRLLGEGQGVGATSQVAFHVAAYDTSRPLIIDPVLVYSTYIGGNNGELNAIISIDSSKDIYVAGTTNSFDFPVTSGSFDTIFSGYKDGFIIKFDQTGAELLFSTYFGGAGLTSDYPLAIKNDTSGNIYLVGYTNSPDFPTTSGAFDNTHNGSWDAFVTKFNPLGSHLLYSTFIGGSGADFGTAMGLDAAGNVYLAGTTASSDFPTTQAAYDSKYDGSISGWEGDGFVAKLNAEATVLIYSTFLGGSKYDSITGLALSDDGETYLTGLTESQDFPTTVGAFDTSHGGSDESRTDAFVTRINSLGSSLIYSTFFGGTDYDAAWGIALDADHNAYITGDTNSYDFPTTLGAYDQTYNGGPYPDMGDDIFISKINPSGSDIEYSSYLGGSGYDSPWAITVDQARNAYVVGETLSSDFPTTPDALDVTFEGGSEWWGDAFVSKFDASGANLNYSTFLGGPGRDFATNIANGPEHLFYITGLTNSTSFPVTAGAFDATFNGGLDVFMVKLDLADYLTVAIDIKPGSFPNSINLGASGTVPVAIFSTTSFDATTVNPTTITLASAPVKLKGQGIPMASFQDVNGDGLMDLVVHVSTQALQLSQTDTQATLNGQTFDGMPISGSDLVRVVP